MKRPSHGLLITHSAPRRAGDLEVEKILADVDACKKLGDAADDANGSENGSGVAYSTNSWSPPLTAETTMTITGDAWTGFAADRWTYNGGTFGPYSVTANYSGRPLGWLVLLPSGLQ